MTDPIEAVARIKKFVTEYKKMRGLDPEHVYGIQAGSEKEAEITISDLEAIIVLHDNS